VPSAAGGAGVGSATGSGAGGAALAVAGAGARHIGIGQINLRIVLGMTLGGIPAVLIAAYIVKEMDLKYVRWLVVVVVVYTAITLLRSAMADSKVQKA